MLDLALPLLDALRAEPSRADAFLVACEPEVRRLARRTPDPAACAQRLRIALWRQGHAIRATTTAGLRAWMRRVASRAPRLDPVASADVDRLVAPPRSDLHRLTRLLDGLAHTTDASGDRSVAICMRLRVDGAPAADVARAEGLAVAAVYKRAERGARLLLARAAAAAAGSRDPFDRDLLVALAALAPPTAPGRPSARTAETAR